MVRLLFLIAVIFAFAFGFAWLADLPGDITILWLDEQVDVNPVVAVVALLIAVTVLLILWSLFRTIIKSPETIRRFFGRRRRDKGYEALSSALIALGSGDSAAAKRFSKDAGKFLNGAPVTRFIEAQVAQQEDRVSDARTIYQDLTVKDETRTLGLHGLFLEARREGEMEVAKHYAQEAVAASPHLPWAGQALFELQCAEEDWEAALKTLENNTHAKLIDRKAARRLRAVLLTARAMELEDGYPDQCRKRAMEAHGLAPELVPASVVAGRVLARLGDVRRAARVLETTWKKDAHPEIAESYAYVRPGDSVNDRLKRIEDLANMRPNNPEGAMAIARVAVDAGKWDMARDALKRVFRSNPTQQAYLLMSELEEAEHGDRGRMREWLARAVRAPRDPAWTADGVVAEEWAPISPVTGRLDAFEWKVPIEESSDEDGALIEDSLFESLPPPPPPIEPAADEAVIVDEAAEEAEEVVVEEVAEVTEPEPVEEAAPAETETAVKPDAGPQEETPAEPAPAAAEAEETAVEPQADAEPVEDLEPVAADGEEAAEEETKPNGHDTKAVEFPFPNPPDDPGPKPKAEPEPKKRFSLFS